MANDLLAKASTTIEASAAEVLLQYTHFSSLAGLPDKPENYHHVTIELAENGTATNVTLSQDNNSSEKDREHSEKNWAMMLEGLKKFVET